MNLVRVVAAASLLSAVAGCADEPETITSTVEQLDNAALLSAICASGAETVACPRRTRFPGPRD